MCLKYVTKSPDPLSMAQGLGLRGLVDCFIDLFNGFRFEWRGFKMYVKTIGGRGGLRVYRVYLEINQPEPTFCRVPVHSIYKGSQRVHIHYYYGIRSPKP